MRKRTLERHSRGKRRGEGADLQNLYKLAKLHQILHDDFQSVAGCDEAIRFLREREPVYPAYGEF